MSGKSNLRKLDLGINEEKDIFLCSINKKIRNNRKKIEAIDELAKKDKATLNQEQLSKIKSKAEVLENIKYHETIKDMYYSAFKTAKDEGRLPQPTGQQAPVAETQAAETIQPVVQESKEDREAETARITSEILSKVLNLVHVAQFYRDQNKEVSEAESIYELYAKIFTFSESDRFVKINDKISGSLNELQSYINGVNQPALRNLSYIHLQQTVERLASSDSFRSHNAEVRVQQARTTAEPSAIGSELRRTEAPVEAEQVVTKSPEKERAAQPAERQEEARQDWGQVEDDEEEEEEEEGVEEEREAEEAEEKEAPRQPEEERKINPYEDFVEVKGRQKEKKEEKPTRGGYRGGQRGGYRGGERGPRKPRVEGEEGQQTEGQQGGYRGGRGGYRGNRPRTEGEGQQEGQQEGENRNREGGYRGGRGGYRGGNRGGYRGGNRGGNFQRRNEEGARQEVRQEAPSS